MPWVTPMFHQRGPTMFMITGLVIAEVALVGVHIGLRRKWSLLVSLGMIALILGIGLFGMMQARGRTDDALGQAENEHERAMFLEEGYKEASRPMQYAGLVGGILVVGVLVAQLRGKPR